jgi:HAD superfamily phosphatase (TIGR01668 family)
VDETGESVEIVRQKGLMFGPDHEVATLPDVSIDELWARGFRGLIIDLDNTVCGYHESTLAPGVREWVGAAKARGFALVLVSNNFRERVAAVGAQLDVPTVSNALKPLPRGFLLALHRLGTARAHTAVIGDQLFTDVLGAKLLGLHAVLTQPLVAQDFPLTRILRMLERVFFARAPRG